MGRMDYRFLLYMAMADAYTAPLDFLRGECKEKVLKHCRSLSCFYDPSPSETIESSTRVRKAAYTAETELAIAVTRALTARKLECGFEDAAAFWFDEFARSQKGRSGYAPLLLETLSTSRDAEDFLVRFKPEMTASKILFGSVPFGLIRNMKTGQTMCESFARRLSSDEEVVQVAQLFAALANYSIWDDRGFEKAPEVLDKTLPWFSQSGKFAQCFEVDWSGEIVARPNIGLALATFSAVVTLLRKRKSTVTILHEAMSWGGNVSSTVSLAWGIASQRMNSYVREDEMPRFLWEDLDTTVGRGFRNIMSIGENFQNEFAAPLARRG